MRLARWRLHGRDHDGIVVGDRLVDLPEGATTLDVIRGGLDQARELGDRVAAAVPESAPAVAAVQLLAPIVPPSVRDFVAFEEHVEGIAVAVDGRIGGVEPVWYEAPRFYFTNPHSLLGSGETVVPPATERLDFELEVGAVLGGVAGSDGRSLAPEDAQGHLFGFAIFNDWSARDLQSREQRVPLGPCKGKDFGTTLGPWITTVDELADRFDADGFLDLEMVVAVNGEEIGRDTLADMGWPFRDLVAYASRNARVVPGDVLGSGTAGTGCLGELWGRAGGLVPSPLQPGDEVTMTVERLGSITNRVGRPVEVPAIGRARPRPGSPAARRRAAAG
ncbi:fumarylacetoacetate hydrolase family protein [Amnibacterium sp. CER49]|uniref:fumarylacetoacetate hydrolase family protein n=1 Tax=Amnibacterium sp. CER49 TaxID=3039161 RepID=UPI002449980C|nr:fumarylacetoacetate hydrolase family protein [Amnibacterium sp. CER49]MDH2444883.1 fumarylacetoacetate hydrolase family protein [Amnibacterium sp. CER49]